MQWFRMYAEFLTDPVVRMLAFEDQRHFVAALCMKASGALDKKYPSPEIRRRAIASLIGLSCDTYDGKPVPLDEANRRLRDLGLVDESWQPINWDKRQFQSDSGAERMRKWRERHRDVTVTSPLRTRSDSEQIQNRKEKKEDARERALGIPGLNREAFERWESYRKQIRKPLRPASLASAAGALSKYGDQQAEVVEQSIAQGWQGLFDLRAKNGKPDPVRTWRPEDEDDESHV